LYVAVAVSAVSLVSWQTLAASSAPLATALGETLGPGAGDMFAGIALAATLNTVLLLLISTTRSLYGMAREKALPQALGAVGERRTPWIAIIVVWALVSLFALFGDLVFVASIANFAILCSFGLVNLSLAVLLLRERGGLGFKYFASLLQPIVGVATCVGLAVMAGWIPFVFGFALAAIGIFIARRFGADAKDGARA
jgi:APA family basic amino acid/polyamine antiporter